MKVIAVASLGLNVLLIALILYSRDSDEVAPVETLAISTPVEIYPSPVVETEVAVEATGFSSGRPDAAAAAAGSGRQLEEIPALPGLGGFNVANPMIARSENPAIQLIEEDRDLSWAPGMEFNLMNEIQAVSADAPMTMLEVQCRTTWCGAVIGLPPGEDRQSRIQIADQLRETFEFQRISRVGFGRRDGSSFIAIYLKAER